MHHQTQIFTTRSEERWVRRPSLRQIFGVLFLILASMYLPAAKGVTPAPDGDYPGANTAEGEDALFSLVGGNFNTAVGYRALYTNNGGSNTALGWSSLLDNTDGGANTAVGYAALKSNTTGDSNTATGSAALFANTTGVANVADGQGALETNSSGGSNTATGLDAMRYNTLGSSNTANGVDALMNNSSGGNNTGIGAGALKNNTLGSRNIALGNNAGARLSSGDDNIDIGNRGVAGESGHIRIGADGTHVGTFIAGIRGNTVSGGVAVMIGISGKLGTAPSSERFKDDIKPMASASEALLALKPVTFRYKEEMDSERIPQFGLVAEEVEKVDPNLVARDEDGKVFGVRYEAVNAMLLNEFLKEHRKVQDLEAAVAEQSRNQKQAVDALSARVKAQAAEIQRVKGNSSPSRSRER